MRVLPSIFLLLLCVPCLAAKPCIDDVVSAIQEVETGGAKDPTHAVGDGGEALGPFQMHRPYYQDAVSFLHDLGLTPPPYRKAVCSDTWAPKLVKAYLARWCPDAFDAVDVATLARVHNGGPGGASKRATIAYANRVISVLKKRGFDL